jgi:hypothetical protein
MKLVDTMGPCDERAGPDLPPHRLLSTYRLRDFRKETRR